jgi:hypothetical protein
MYLKKGAGYTWISKFDQAIESLSQATKFKTVFTEQEIEEIHSDIEKIQLR